MRLPHFPDPREVWIGLQELHAEYAAYKSLSPIVGKRVMQLGGGGFHAVKFLLAGAAHTHVVSGPSTSEKGVLP
jgi:hypothetical protein